MPSIINTNMASLNSQRHLNASQSALSVAMERLSSGKRINSAKDDAAGLGIAERMTSQINGMNQAIRNAKDGISLAQTAEGALSTMNDMLQRVRVLAVQASNATNSPADRQALQDEVGQLVSELNRLAEVTTFNGQHLLNGTMGSQHFQIGPNAGETVSANGTNFLTTTYGNYRVEQDGVTPQSSATAKSGGVSKITGYLGAADLNITITDSARTITEKINNLTSETGVSATATTTAFIGGMSAGSTYALQVQSNNAEPVIISFALGPDLTLNATYAAAVNAFNAQTAKTGIIAEFDSIGGIKLVNQSGNDISVLNTLATTANLYPYNADGTIGTPAGIPAGSPTADPVVAFGTLTLDSPNSFVVESTGTGLSASDEYPIAGTGALMAVADLNVATFTNAQKALQIVDSALIHVVGEMARYGALQKRFEATVSNLEVTSENTTNSRSRIQDADYAQETAALSRATILQQAGTSMLAQANQIPQMVLNLLQ